MTAKAKAKARRPIEREYLATLNAAVPLDAWQAICKRAADDALAGDARARDWLGKLLLHVQNSPLTKLAAEEAGGTPEAAADDEVDFQRRQLADRRRQAERSLERSVAIDALFDDLDDFGKNAEARGPHGRVRKRGPGRAAKSDEPQASSATPVSCASLLRFLTLRNSLIKNDLAEMTGIIL